MDTHPAKYKRTRSAGRTGLSCTDNPDEHPIGKIIGYCSSIEALTWTEKEGLTDCITKIATHLRNTDNAEI